MTTWHSYLEGKDPSRHTISGDVRVLRSVYSGSLRNERDVLVYLPPSYRSGSRRYPVIYMHDGQNLFDSATSYAGEWHVDETMQALSAEGIEAMIVGVPNVGEARTREYQPFPHPYFGTGQGDVYLSFVLETIKPLIDADFRTLPDRAHTGMIGSSLGGLITLYAYFRFTRLVGFAGALSPSLWIARTPLRTFIDAAPSVPGRLYLDIGTAEYSPESQRRWKYDALADHRGMAELLEHKGYRRGESLVYTEDKDGRHNEADWARRLPDALRFLLQPFTVGVKAVEHEAE